MDETAALDKVGFWEREFEGSPVASKLCKGVSLWNERLKRISAISQSEHQLIGGHHRLLPWFRNTGKSSLRVKRWHQPVWTGSESWFWKFLESCCRFYLPLSPYWQHLTERNEKWQPTRAAIIQCRTGSPRMTSAWVIGQFLYAGSGISKALWIPVNQLNEPSEVPASLSKIFETDTADTFQRVQLHNQHADSATQIVSNQILFPTLWDDREASRQCCQVPQKVQCLQFNKVS